MREKEEFNVEAVAIDDEVREDSESDISSKCFESGLCVGRGDGEEFFYEPGETCVCDLPNEIVVFIFGGRGV